MQRSIVFMGSDPIALPLLAYLEASPLVKFSGIFTQPDRPKGRGQSLYINPIKAWALERAIPVLQPEKVGEAEISWIQSTGVQLAFVMAYGQLLKQPLLDAFPLGAWNFHTSILPAYRGPCPIEAAILNGDSTTGVTLMQMVLKMDAGAVVDIERVLLARDETTPTLREKLALACPCLLERQLLALTQGHPPLKPQDEATASYVRKLTKEDGALDFNLPAYVLERRIRAYQPWPGAFFDHNGIRLKVGAAYVITGPVTTPGTILEVTKTGLVIATSEDCLVITQLQRPMGRMLPIESFPLKTLDNASI